MTPADCLFDDVSAKIPNDRDASVKHAAAKRDFR